MSDALKVALNLAPAELLALSLILETPLPETLQIENAANVDVASTLGCQTLVARGLLLISQERIELASAFVPVCKCLFTPDWLAVVAMSAGDGLWHQAWHVLGHEAAAVLVSAGAGGTVFCQFVSDAEPRLKEALGSTIRQAAPNGQYRVILSSPSGTTEYSWRGTATFKAGDTVLATGEDLLSAISAETRELVRLATASSSSRA